MATEFYYNDGGTWRKAKEMYYNDAATWRKAKELWYNDGGTWRKVFSGAVFSAIAGSADRDHIGSGVKSVTLTVSRDGTWQLTSNNALGTTISPSGVQTWIVPGAADSGDTRWIRVARVGDVTSGSAVSPTVLALSAAQSWTLTAVTSGDAFLATLTVNIYADAGATILLSTGTVTLTAVKG